MTVKVEDLRIGQTVHAVLFGGERVQGTIDLICGAIESYDDYQKWQQNGGSYEDENGTVWSPEGIKNGRSGVDLINTSRGYDAWCYVSQIVEVRS